MTLSTGERLGPYEILAPVGAGGMGEVWKARDTRLDRSVAIKILPAGLAEDAQFKLRFEREAKTISQLNHPHIAEHDLQPPRRNLRSDRHLTGRAGDRLLGRHRP